MMDATAAVLHIASLTLAADSNGCTVFTGGSRTRSGHRTKWIDGRTVGVHRFVWAHHHGPVPAGLVVRHSCDNPPCVNLEHLLLGTVADNNRDRDERGRHADMSGSRNPQAKLTEVDVVEILRQLGASRPGRSIAAQFGVTEQLVSQIKRGVGWPHVPRPQRRRSAA